MCVCVDRGVNLLAAQHSHAFAGFRPERRQVCLAGFFCGSHPKDLKYLYREYKQIINS